MDNNITLSKPGRFTRKTENNKKTFHSVSKTSLRMCNYQIIIWIVKAFFGGNGRLSSVSHHNKFLK
jgi:flagellar motor switch protein FliM